MHDELITPGMTANELLLRRRVRRLAEFYRHLILYGVSMAVAWTTLIFFTDTWTTTWWGGLTIGATVSWSVGVVFHALRVLPPQNTLSLDWQEKRIREILDRCQHAER